MRVVSQAGDIDLPYENTIMKRHESSILAQDVHSGSVYLIGEYSTVEQAKAEFVRVLEYYHHGGRTIQLRNDGVRP